MRTDPDLLPLTPPSHAIAADIDTFRRAKSDDEIERLNSLHRQVAQGMKHRDGDSFGVWVTRRTPCPRSTYAAARTSSTSTAVA